MPGFWPACPYDRADRNADGSLRISDNFLRALWQRDEVAPVAESCRNERSLHAKLLANPRELLSKRQLASIADRDARQNYVLLQTFVARLLAASSAEDAYRRIFSRGNVDIAPLFIDLLVELILRDMLRDCTDAHQVRAAELLFRPQKVSIQQGAVLLADAEAIDRHASGKSFGPLGQLLVDANIKPRNVPLDVLNDDNSEQYWQRSSHHDLVLPFNYEGPGLPAFCRVLEQWIDRMMDLQVDIAPIPAIKEQQWAWHIGLDAEATTLMNELYVGKALADDRQRRILALFDMHIRDADAGQRQPGLRPEVRGRKIYLACAMTDDSRLRIKPQNLLLNMPLAGPQNITSVPSRNEDKGT